MSAYSTVYNIESLVTNWARRIMADTENDDVYQDAEDVITSIQDYDDLEVAVDRLVEVAIKFGEKG